MKDGIKLVEGKTISDVVYVKPSDFPDGQKGWYRLYIVFDDDTHFEIYSHDEFTCTNGVDPEGWEVITERLSGIQMTFETYGKHSDSSERKQFAQKSLELEPSTTTAKPAISKQSQLVRVAIDHLRRHSEYFPVMIRSPLPEGAYIPSDENIVSWRLDAGKNQIGGDEYIIVGEESLQVLFYGTVGD